MSITNIENIPFLTFTGRVVLWYFCSFSLPSFVIANMSIARPEFGKSANEGWFSLALIRKAFTTETGFRTPCRTGNIKKVKPIEQFLVLNVGVERICQNL